MGTNLNQALSELDFMAEIVEKQVEDVEKELVSHIFETLIDSPGKGGTPVDTGWASAGWRVSINTPTSGSVSETGSVPIAKTLQSSSFKSFMGADLSGVDSIFIDNRVPYIRDLNAGSSAQAPPHFVEMAV